MTLAQYAGVAHERRRTIATLAALGALSFLAYGWSRPPSFAATAQLFVSSTADVKVGDVDSAPRLEQRVHTYAELSRSREVLAAAIAQLQLPMSPDQLESMVSASAVPNTVLLDVTVTDLSPTRARDIANAIGTQLPALVARVERPASGAPAPVALELTHPADEPRSPVSPGRAATLLVGLAAGLGLGLVTALVRGALDGTVRTRAQAARAAGTAVLAEVVDDPDAARKPLITSDAFGPRTEAVRQLRTSLRCLPEDRPARSIVVASAVGGEGRTSTACNLAIALAQAGENVVLVDADLRRPGVAELLGLTEQAGLTSVLAGELGIMQALQSWRIDLPLRVLAAGPLPPNPSELIGSPRMAALVTALADSGVTVVLDSPALLPVTDGVILSRIVDGVVLVTRSGSTSCDDLTRARETVQQAGGTVLGVLLNRTRHRCALGSHGLAAAQALAGEGWHRRMAERTTPADTLAASVSGWQGDAGPGDDPIRHELSEVSVAVAAEPVSTRYPDPVRTDDVEPRYVEPRYVEPRYVEPRYVEPRYLAPAYADPSDVPPAYPEPAAAHNGHSPNGSGHDGYAHNGNPVNGYPQPDEPAAWSGRQPLYPGQPVPRQLTPERYPPEPYPPESYPAAPSRPPGVERRQGRRRLAPPPDTHPVGYPRPAERTHPDALPHTPFPGMVDRHDLAAYSVPEPEPIPVRRPPEAIDVRDHAPGTPGRPAPADPSVWAPPTVWDPLLRTNRLPAAPAPDFGHPTPAFEALTFEAPTFETLRANALPARRHRH